jgi:hypothetical protein
MNKQANTNRPSFCCSIWSKHINDWSQIRPRRRVCREFVLRPIAQLSPLISDFALRAKELPMAALFFDLYNGRCLNVAEGLFFAGSEPAMDVEDK